MLSFNFRMNTPPGTMTWTAGDEMTVLRLEGVSTTANPVYLTLIMRFAGGGVWNPVFQNEGNENVITAVNLVTSTWYVFAALGNSNPDATQMGRLITNINSNVYKVFLPQPENWDFTNSVTLKYFATAMVAPFYFHGSVGRIDYVGAAYDTTVGTTTSDSVLEWHLPYMMVWLDMTDPEVTQYFQNRIMNEYGSTMNGFTNHSDYQDIQFDFNQGWIIRKNVQRLVLPTPIYYADMDINFVYIIKFKVRKVNHWSQGSENLRIFEYTQGGGYYTLGYLFKYNYGSPVTIRLNYPGMGGWDMCGYAITPANELGESAEVAVSMHVFRPPYYRTSTEFRQSCTLTSVTGTRRYTAGNAV